jgi:hypothetical protein
MIGQPPASISVNFSRRGTLKGYLAEADRHYGATAVLYLPANILQSKSLPVKSSLGGPGMGCRVSGMAD